MSATIRRGAPPRGRAPVRKKPPQSSFLHRTLGRLPISQDLIRKGATTLILLAGGAVVIAGAVWMGVPGVVGRAVADTAGQAGLRVEKVEVTGLKRMDFMTVNAVALDQRSLAMPAVDLEGVRARLLAYGWIKEAHVSRRLPNTLLIDIEERSPAAVWQNEVNLMLVDASGVLLEPVDKDHMPKLPLVIGPGADRQEAGYTTLLSAAPALARHVRAATWVGNRRWDLTFDTGETLALPEGEREAATALARFAGLNGGRPPLGRGWVRFDMRDPTKLVARRPSGEAQALADPGGAAAPAKKDNEGGADNG